MIETIASVGMLVEETMKIKKNRLMPDEIAGNEKRFCIVSGIYGDELGGQYICYEVIRRIKADYKHLKGIVDVYPSVNPMALDSLQRDIPLFDMDMNTLFPGSYEGTIGEYTAARLVDDMRGANFCLDVHTSNLALRELPQVRMNDDKEKELIPYAQQLNVDIVWVHPSTSVLNGSLAYSLNEIGIKTIVMEHGVGLRIDYDICNQIVDGIFSFMRSIGIWDGDTISPKNPRIAHDDEITFINAESSGIFIPKVAHSRMVKKGDCIGDIVSVITGSVEESIIAPCSGIVFSLREYPAIEEGSLICRILEVSDYE